MLIVPTLAGLAFGLLVYRAFADFRPVHASPAAAMDNVVAQLRQRLVRGEIDRSDFERIVSMLNS